MLKSNEVITLTLKPNLKTHKLLGQSCSGYDEPELKL